MRVWLTIALLALPSWFVAGCGMGLSHVQTASSPAPATEQPAVSRTPGTPTRELLLVRVADNAGEAAAPPDAPSPTPPVSIDPKKNQDAKPAPNAAGKSPEAAAEPQEPSPTALQETPGPKADDRLLGLLQKEIEEAMQQPSGRRKIQFSMGLVENERVRYFIDFFCGKMRGFFVGALARSGKYIPMMANVLQEAGLPEDLVYLSLIESGFAPSAYS